MLNLMMKLILAILVLNMAFTIGSFTEQILSATLFILILKIFSLEEKIDALQHNAKNKSHKNLPATKTETATEIPTQKDDYADIFPDSNSHPVAQIETPKKDSSANDWLKKRLLTGNPMAKIGVIILFIGMTFFIKYVAEQNLLSIEIRHVIVALAGMCMICLGCYLAPTNKNYADTLSGGGIGLMYLTVYSAFHIYHLLMPVPAFVMLSLIVVLSGIIAVLQNAKLLALFGILGGFLAPILISDGSNNYVFLFSYYLVLNCAVLSLAFFKSWWELNMVGFVFTFIISALWGWQSYQPAFFNTTESFLIIFFLFYVAIAILYAAHHPRPLKGISHSFILFANPVIAFGMQTALIQHYTYGIAISAATLCVFYALLASIFYFSVKSIREISTAFCGLALLFGTISIPYTFTHLWAATNWALESIILLWWSIRQGNPKLRLASGLIMMASMVMFLVNLSSQPNPAVFFSEYYLSALFIIFALLTHSYLLYKNASPGTMGMTFARLFILIGVPGWYLLNIGQIQLYVWFDQQYIDIIIFIASSCMVSWLAGSYLNWKWLYYPAIALLPAMVILSLPDNYWLYYHPAGINLAWLYSFAILYTILYLHDEVPASYLPTLHLITFLYLTWFITYRIDLALAHQSSWPDYWRVINSGLLPAMMLLLVSNSQRLLRWPLEKYEYSYQQFGGLILSSLLLAWVCVTCLYSGDVARIHYIPLFNPLDGTIMLTLFTITIWLNHTETWLEQNIAEFTMLKALFILSIIGFAWLNAILLRSLHHWLEIPYRWDPLWHSMTVQTTVSICWSVAALLITTLAARMNSRSLWFCGFALMWVVIIKLLLVDLSDANTIGRIITFVGVGIIMLINGYLSPLPPREP